MKIKAFHQKQFFLFTFLVGFLLPLLGSCSSKRELISPLEAEKLRSNPYFIFYEKQSPDFQKLLARSSFYLVRGTNEVFLENVSATKTAQGFFKSLAQPMIHGDFHADQMAKIESIDTLEDLDTADFAPFWIDLVRQEMSAQVLAKESSLKTYTPGSCVQSYVETLRGRAPKSSSVGTPFFGQVPVPPQNDKPKEVFTPSPWTNGTTLATDDPMKTALEKEWQSLFPEKKLKELKRIRAGVGSFLSTNYMGQSEDNTYIEFKELDTNPLKALRGASKAGAMKPCDRFLLAGKIFKPSFKLQCSEVENKIFMVNPYREAYVPPRLSKLSRPEELIAHEIWMCAELAKAHRKTWTPSDVKILLRAWDSNPLLGERILMQAQNQFELITSAYRTILSAQK